jgi:hypothetical protein
MVDRPEPNLPAEGSGIFGRLPAMRRRDELVVTLAVTAEDARGIALAGSAGAVSLALHPSGDIEDDDGAGPTTISHLAGGRALLPMRKSFREYKGR